MAFGFRWQNYPQAQVPANGAEAERAAFIARQRAQAQGFDPSASMQAMNAQQQAQGIVPNAPAQVPVTQAAPDLTGYAQSMQASLKEREQFQALREEYARNQAQIDNLKAQLEKARADMGSDEAFMDELAANRAERGDTGYHQNMMQWRWNNQRSQDYLEKEKRENAEIEKKKLVQDLEDIDMQLPYIENEQAKNVALKKRERIASELKEKFGMDYAAPEAGVMTEGELNDFKVNYTNQDGTWKSERARNFYESNVRDAQKRKDAQNTRTEQERDARAAASERKKKDAIAEAKKGFSRTQLAAGNGSYTVKTSNGKTVTVTRTASGDIIYECEGVKG